MKEMTEEQLETVARLLCEKRGIDPRAYTLLNGDIGGCLFSEYKNEIRAQCEVMLCIAEVMDKEENNESIQTISFIE